METVKDDLIEPVLVEEGVKWFDKLYGEAESTIESELQRISVVINAFMLEVDIFGRKIQSSARSITTFFQQNPLPPPVPEITH